MKKLLYVLTSAFLLAGLFTACEKEEKAKSTIKGVVTDKETGEPLSGVTLELQPTGRQTQTAEDGVYIFENLKAGIYTLRVQKEGYPDYASQEIQLGVEQMLILDITILAESIPRVLEGKVTDKATGDPLSGVTLELQPTGQQTQTAEDGAYIFENLKADIYTIKAQKEGYGDYIQEGIQFVADQTTTLDIEMEDEYKADDNYMVTIYGLNMEMVYVKGGEFEMGATAEQDEVSDDEKPVRPIKLESYHIGKYEVTQVQWRAVMGTDPSEFKGDNLPVEQVSWEEAQAFCKKLSEATGRKYVLPTEAQWEYAARGGQYKDGTKYAGSNTVEDVAWYANNSSKKTHPVGAKQPNGLGLYDMSGNVWEWCLDWYGNYDENDTENPQGPANGTYRVGRGGSWIDKATGCRVSDRNYNSADKRYINQGFRVAVLPQ